MASSSPELETGYRVLADRVRDKTGELATAEAAHAETVTALVDGNGDRAKVLAHRAVLAVEADALRAELGELTRRRDAADLLRFESALAAAEHDLQATAAKGTELRTAMNAAMNAVQRARNAPAHGAETPESAAALAELEVVVVRRRSESAVAGRATDVARHARDDAAAALESARVRLGIGGLGQRQASSSNVKG